MEDADVEVMVAAPLIERSDRAVPSRSIVGQRSAEEIMQLIRDECAEVSRKIDRALGLLELSLAPEVEAPEIEPVVLVAMESGIQSKAWASGLDVTSREHKERQRESQAAYARLVERERLKALKTDKQEN